MGSSSLGNILGCAFPSIEVTLAVTPVIFVPMIIYSGFFINSDSIPSYVKFIELTSPFRYSLECYAYNDYEGLDYTPDPLKTLNFTLGYWKSFLILFVLGMVFRIIGFIALYLNAILL